MSSKSRGGKFSNLLKVEALILVVALLFLVALNQVAFEDRFLVMNLFQHLLLFFRKPLVAEPENQRLGPRIVDR